MTSILHSVVEPEIDPKNIWQDDLLDRKKLSDILLELINGCDGNISFQLESSYGTGKTFFLRRFAKEAERYGHVVVHYDAWENDLTDEPIPSLSASLLSQLKKATPFEGHSEKFDGLQQALIPIVSKCIVGGLSHFVFGDADFAGKMVTSELSKLAQGQAANYIDNYNKSFGEIDKVKKEFENISNLEQIKNKKIILIIDELDRCRPDFAITILEAIKHLFKVNNIVFIVSTDKEALESIISKVYGPTIDHGGYLKRHFDYLFSLNDLKSDKFILRKLREYKIIDEVNSGDNFKKSYDNDLFNIINLPLKIDKIILRDIDSILKFAQLGIFILGNIKNRNNYIICHLILFLIFKKCDKKNYNEFISYDNFESNLLYIDFVKNNTNEADEYSIVGVIGDKDKEEFCKAYGGKYSIGIEDWSFGYRQHFNIKEKVVHLIRKIETFQLVGN